MPESLETLDLFDNQLDQVDNHLTGLSLLVRVDIGENNLSSEMVKSLGPRLSCKSNVAHIVRMACAGIRSYRTICEIGVVKFLWEEANAWWEWVVDWVEENGRRSPL